MIPQKKACDFVLPTNVDEQKIAYGRHIVGKKEFMAEAATKPQYEIVDIFDL